MALVLLKLCWDCGKQVRLHQRRDRNGAPRVGGHIPDGDGTSWRERPVTLRPSPRAQGGVPRLAKRGRPAIGRIVQDPPDHTPIPHRLARARHFARVRETPTHLANAQTSAPDPGKHLAHHAGFVRHNLLAGWASTHMLVDVAGTRGRPAEHMHHTGACGM
jgi:hypothetical protein